MSLLTQDTSLVALKDLIEVRTTSACCLHIDRVSASAWTEANTWERVSAVLPCVSTIPRRNAYVEVDDPVPTDDKDSYTSAAQFDLVLSTRALAREGALTWRDGAAR